MHQEIEQKKKKLLASNFIHENKIAC